MAEDQDTSADRYAQHQTRVLRLDCLRLAVDIVEHERGTDGKSDVLTLADRYAQFVLSGTVPQIHILKIV